MLVTVVGFGRVLDLEKEDIMLVTAENISVEKLSSKVPESNARYHLFKFKYTHEGDYMEDIGNLAAVWVVA